MSVRRLLLLLVLLLGVVVAAIAISTRMEGEKQLARYAEISRAALADFPLQPHPVSVPYRRVRSLPLMDITVTSSSGERLARVNALDATMFLCMKVYTLIIRPDEAYNLPMLSADFVFLPFGKRVYVIEVIDPAHIDDANKQKHYARMRAIQAGLSGLPAAATRDWYRDYLAGFSVHSRASQADDALLQASYQAWLAAYLDMVRAAPALPVDTSRELRAGTERYVATLLAEGGPAVDVFRRVLGPERQQEYVRTVMFGLDGPQSR
jgi:hypothetical protein